MRREQDIDERCNEYCDEAEDICGINQRYTYKYCMENGTMEDELREDELREDEIIGDIEIESDVESKEESAEEQAAILADNTKEYQLLIEDMFNGTSSCYFIMRAM